MSIHCQNFWITQLIIFVVVIDPCKRPKVVNISQKKFGESLNSISKVCNRVLRVY
jgi:hypothetical protein